MQTKTNSNLKPYLIEMGLNDKEAQVYLALLEMGKGTVSNIAQKAGIQRTTGYSILDGLANKGLVIISGKKPKQEYIAEPPEKIAQFLKTNIAQLQEQLKKAQNIAPQLKSILKSGSKAQVKFYEGEKGLKEVYENTLTSSEEIKAFATLDDMYLALPGYFPDYFKRRAKKKIPIKAILPSTEMAKTRIKQDRAELRTSILVPKDKYYFSPEINIYDNKVMIASWREKLGIIIESEEIADALKKIYELAWLGAKQLQKSSKN